MAWACTSQMSGVFTIWAHHGPLLALKLLFAPGSLSQYLCFWRAPTRFKNKNSAMRRMQFSRLELPHGTCAQVEDYWQQMLGLHSASFQC